MASEIVAGEVERKLLEELHEAKDMLQYASDTFGQLSALFGAIRRGEGGAKELAGLGQYVANDWENSLDVVRESIEQQLNLLPSMLLVRAAA